MRVRPGTINECFTSWIKRLSYDDSLIDVNKVTPPEYVEVTDSLSSLIDTIYPAAVVENAVCDWVRFADRAILAPLNDTVTELNNRILNEFPGEDRTYESINTHDVNDEDGLAQVPSEFLRHVDLPSLPPLRLRLKVGVPVMCLRNMFPTQELCNESRGIVTRMQRHSVAIRLLNGDFAGETRILFRTKLSTNENELPYILTRKQFPIKVCFAMTINKAQGQSFNEIGVDLRHSVFTHGQFYVAVSRATDAKGLHLLLPEGQTTTDNIVYSEVLTMFNDT